MGPSPNKGPFVAQLGSGVRTLCLRFCGTGRVKRLQDSEGAWFPLAEGVIPCEPERVQRADVV